MVVVPPPTHHGREFCAIPAGEGRRARVLRHTPGGNAHGREFYATPPREGRGCVVQLAETAGYGTHARSGRGVCAETRGFEPRRPRPPHESSQPHPPSHILPALPRILPAHPHRVTAHPPNKLLRAPSSRRALPCPADEHPPGGPPGWAASWPTPSGRSPSATLAPLATLAASPSWPRLVPCPPGHPSPSPSRPRSRPPLLATLGALPSQPPLAASPSRPPSPPPLPATFRHLALLATPRRQGSCCGPATPAAARCWPPPPPGSCTTPTPGSLAAETSRTAEPRHPQRDSTRTAASSR